MGRSACLYIAASRACGADFRGATVCFATDVFFLQLFSPAQALAPGFPPCPSPKQPFVAMPALGAFLQTNGLTDPKIINYMTKTLQLERVSDFASDWTSAVFEKGIQTDIGQQVVSQHNGVLLIGQQVVS